MKASLFLLSACAAATLAAAPPRLTNLGIEIDGAAMGKLILGYPQFTPDGGKGVKPEVKVEGDRAELTYLAEKAPAITLVREESKILITMKTQAPGKLNWQMNIPITFAGTGEFSFGKEGKTALFPKDLPAKPHLAQLNSDRFLLVDANSDCRISIQSEPGAYWQLQDNRAWNWKIFQLNIMHNVYDNRTHVITLDFNTIQPEKAKVRVDRFGQPKELAFPGKITSEEELKAEAANDDAWLASQKAPQRTPWGGLPGRSLNATGFFRLDQVEGRDVLVTPAGDIFFQLGVCSVSPCDDYTYIKGRESIYEWLPPYESPYKTAYRGHWATDFSYYIANLIRKTGQPFELDGWKRKQVERLRQWGFNSEGAFTAASPVNRETNFGRTPGLYKPKGIVGDICDPFDPAIRKDLDENFKKLAESANDPTIIGYFIANEQNYPDVPRKLPTFDGKVAAKRELVASLAKQYGSIETFNAAWGMKAGSFAELNDLALPVQTQAAWNDMEQFSARFFDAYFKMIGETFRKYDPNHLLIGARFLVANANVESAVAACGRYCDIFSYNYYARTIDSGLLERIHKLAGKPILLSEWSFGTAEQGLAGGVIDVKNQQERGLAYRSYVEETAALPFVVGSQWFAYIDQALTGRFFQHYNGECMNIGLVNVADRPFRDFLAEAMKTNERIYDVKLGKAAPFSFRTNQARAPKSLQIPHALPGHKLDGLRDPWPGRPSERIDAGCLVAGADDGGVSADFWLCWDDANLYLFAEVKDPTPMKNSRKGINLWQSDCIELFIGGESPEKEGPLLFSDRQLLISAAPGGGTHLVNQPEQPAIGVVTVPRPGGYAVEAAIPWKALGITSPQSGTKLRFDLGLDNGDDGPKRLHQFMWSGSAGNNANRTAWGSATLVN